MPGPQNSLARASSAYLRSAMHQPVDWQQWGTEAFDHARAADKPILLDIGAVWCHWCHVMDRESYEDPATAEIINQHFIPVKVDRDERPDVDTRYQAAVAAISGQGGWPLTAFLTPDGKPFFGGTYFPPEDRHGRPSFQRVLLTMADAFEKRRDEVNESAGSVVAAIEHNESFSGRGGDLSIELVTKLIESALKQFDTRSGGFGSQPKFPHSGAIDLLLDVASRPPAGADPDLPASARQAAVFTLEQMARGGIYDHLAGGFHRYSVDEHWVVPHFEKMAYDNSELLRNYVHAFRTLVRPDFARTASEIIGWMDAWLSDRDLGGFYASQDADFSLDDDGDYFTWTRDEAAQVLTPEELAFASTYFEINEVGNMHGNPAKNVLHITGTLGHAARTARLPEDSAPGLLASVKKKMYAARLLRPTPFVDKTVYVGWNGMCISAYIEAGRVLDLPEVTTFALKSLDRVLREAWDPTRGMAHVVAYGETSGSGEVSGSEESTGFSGRKDHVAGILDDYLFIAHASLDAWETTGDMLYFRTAEAIADMVLARFYDRSGFAFFDTPAPAEGETPLGVLSARRKPLQDSPTPAANPVAAALLLRLEALTGRADLRTAAEETLQTFAGIVEHFGLYASSYGLALGRFVHGTVQVCIVGEGTDARELEAVSLARYAVNKSVIRLRRDQLADLPPALAETLPHLPGLKDSQAKAMAIVCSGKTCQLPVTDPDDLLALLSGTV